MKAKSVLAILAALSVGGAVIAALNRDEIALTLLKRGANQALAHPTIEGLKAGLHAGFCGTGSPMPDRDRAGPCLAIIAGGKLFVFDAGEGSAETLNLMGLPTGQVQAVFLTHFHSDHIDGLGSLGLQRWASSSATTPLPLYGPTGVEQIAAGLSQVYAQDRGYRVAHHGADIVPPAGFGFEAKAFAPPAIGAEAVVYDRDDLKIIAFGVDHRPIEPALGYRIEYGGQKIVISGDTKMCDCVTKAADGATLLVHEAIAPNLTQIMGQAAKGSGQAGVAQVFHDIENYHATPSQIADIATRAKVGGVALTHIVPALPLKGLERPFLGDATQKFKGPFWIMQDGDLVSLDRDGKLTKRRVLRD
ncbi:MBL fold metallo-hydrolase [Aquidulcibacter paucihalophilus]|uniref:MBL fold metallo-hydrolase n=1 Tax=Aquidulcibacter paucihalophilus TaxID=1978549 RepID=UPI000A19830D|nr:MBL fold metallo-hydrolase [Aquidulcibacter paucihalophilus]